MTKDERPRTKGRVFVVRHSSFVRSADVQISSDCYSKDTSMPKVHSFDANAIDWTAHPQFAGLLIKVLESRATHPHMSMMLVRLESGGVISTHVHATETETAYVLAGRGVLKLGDNAEGRMQPRRGV